MDNLIDQIVRSLSTVPTVLSIALGGSRSRGHAEPDSDFDLFVVIDDIGAEDFMNGLAGFFSSISSDILFFGKDKYLEEWGYLFCGLDKAGFFYDVAVIQRSRIGEMFIRSTNVVLFDTDDVFKNAQRSALDIDYKSPDYLSSKVFEVTRMVYLNYFRFLKNFTGADYWMAFRFLNILRENIFKLHRIKANTPSKLFFLPDEKFEKETGRDFREAFIVDGSFDSLARSAQVLIGLFSELNDLPDPIIIHLHQIFSFDYGQAH